MITEEKHAMNHKGNQHVNHNVDHKGNNYVNNQVITKEKNTIWITKRSTMSIINVNQTTGINN